MMENPPVIAQFPVQTTKAIAKSRPGRVKAFLVTNAANAMRYFQIHNKTTLPTAGDVPIFYYPLAAGAGSSIYEIPVGSDLLGPSGIYLSLGVAWAISTTAETFTDAATPLDHHVLLRVE